jgi:hypothetical protein
MNRPAPCVSIENFESGVVDPDRFDHEAHVYVAWLYLKAFPRRMAADRYCAALRRLTEKVGVPGKYHETITRFLLQQIAERYAAAPHEGWSEFRLRNDELCSGAAAILQRHYSRELLSSESARAAFLMPDRSAA